MPAPKFTPTILFKLSSSGDLDQYDSVLAGHTIYVAPQRLFDKVQAYCCKVRKTSTIKPKGLSEEGIFRLYQALYSRSRLAEKFGLHIEATCNADGYFTVNKAFLEQYGGKSYGPNRDALISLGFIKKLEPYQRTVDSWTTQQVKILKQHLNSGLVAFQCPKSNYAKMVNEYPKEYPALDPTFVAKHEYLKTLHIDPAYADYLGAMIRKYPNKRESIESQGYLVTDFTNEIYRHHISTKTGRHYFIVPALKRELRGFIRDAAGNRFWSLDIKTTLARMLYVLLKGYLVNLPTLHNGPSANMVFKGYQPESGTVDGAALYSFLYKLPHVWSGAFEKLSRSLSDDDRANLLVELPKLQMALEADFYSEGVKWFKEDFPKKPLLTREDVKTRLMPFLYGKTPPSYGKSYGACFEKRFPTIGKAIRALKMDLSGNDAHKDMALYIQGLEGHIVQKIITKDLFSRVGGVFIVHDAVFFIKRYRHEVEAVLEAYMKALGFNGKSLELEENTVNPTDWKVTKKPNRKRSNVTGELKLKGTHPRQLRRLQAGWNKATTLSTVQPMV